MLQIGGILGKSLATSTILLGIILINFLGISLVANASIFDDTRQLEGMYISDTGELKKLTCPIGGKYDCLSWSQDLYQFGELRCMVVHGYYDGFSPETALLAVNQSNNSSVFVLTQTIGGVSVKHYSVTGYECPEMF